VKRIDLSGAPLSTDASLGTVIESLSRFTSLTVFNVIQCPNALDDKVLQFICSKLTQLREFGFSHCDYVTDFGLTGCQDGEVTRPGLGFLTGKSSYLTEFTSIKQVIYKSQQVWHGGSVLGLRC